MGTLRMPEKGFVSLSNLLGLELESCMLVKSTFYFNSQDLFQKSFEKLEKLKAGSYIILNKVSLR
jgi:hypothetical protein